MLNLRQVKNIRSIAMAKTKYFDYKVEQRWNVNLAEFEWVLYGSRAYDGYKGDFSEDVEDGLVWGEIATGDEKWASRTAEHFGISYE